MSLTNKAFSGVVWTFSQQLSSKLINFIVQIILARILLPSDFGLIAMIMVFISIGNSLADSGLTSSLIRTNKANDRDYSTVFFINLFGSITIYWIVFFIAPYISIFYNQEVLTNIIRVFSLSFIIRAFAGVQTTILTKELHFKKQMMMQLPAIIIAGMVGVILAYLGYGVWSLVWLNLVQSFLYTLQHWIKSSWYPSFIIDKELLKIHFGFGFRLTLASLLNTIYSNIYNLVIGKLFSPVLLGYYNRADTIQKFPLSTFINAFKHVAYPVLSNIKEDNRRLRDGYKRMMLQVVFWITPLLIFLIIVAEPLFRFLLTEKWVPAVPYFQILCASSLLYPLEEYNLQILDVKGRSDIYLKIEVIKKGIAVMIIVLAIPFGIYGLLYAQVLLSIIYLFISSFYSNRLLSYSIGQQLKSVLPIFSLSFFLGGITWCTYTFFVNREVHDLMKILFVTIFYFGGYFIISYMFKFSVYVDIKRIISFLYFKIKK